ncbi:MAG: CHC2 zinc finger domain-containing protein, partial [Candidatus Phytoplasma australasiaticum]|nr:CHC2 zinc finger domain-containing protein [Candidatus Phytoplasma australasiaticum]
MNHMRKKLSFIEQINKKIPIHELVSRYAGITLEKKGKNFMSLCPFHKEKTPSFSVSPEKNIAVCMACHEGGSPTAFWAKLKKKNYRIFFNWPKLRAATVFGHLVESRKISIFVLKVLKFFRNHCPTRFFA